MLRYRNTLYRMCGLSPHQLRPTRSGNAVATSRNPLATHRRCRTHYGVSMKTNIETIRLRVQETIDELFSERLIPIKLTAYNVSGDGLGEYVARFYDSRLHSIRFSWNEGTYLRETIRAAILGPITKVSASLMVPRILTPQASLGSSI